MRDFGRCIARAHLEVCVPPKARMSVGVDMASNIALERAVGSPSLVTAAQCRRYAAQAGAPGVE
jgi:hypothetical protein